MNVIALLLILLGAAGAWAPQPAGVAGRYVLEGGHEMGSELVLKPGGEFEFMLAYGAADYTAKGKWKSVGETVVLDSKLPDGPAFKLVKSADLRSPDVRVWVKGTSGKPVENLEVVLTSAEGEARAHTDRDGMAIFAGVSKPKSVVISVPVYEKDSGVVELNGSHTDFTFEINADAITSVPFKGEVLKVKGDTLEMTHWDKEKPMVYRRH
jgi:hypothetical protein